MIRRFFSPPVFDKEEDNFRARFINGFAWVVKSTFMEFKRPLNLGDTMLIETWIDDFFKDGVKVQFRILKKDTKKECCVGYFDYTMISISNGRAAIIPEWITERYSI